jgi:pimeloyl-ACP methyl ester carboxylesterase
MLTAAIFSASILLLAGGFINVGLRPVLFILVGAMVGGAMATGYLHGPDRVVAFILVDFATIIAVKLWHDRSRDRLVSAIAILHICFAILYIVGSYINYWTYAALLNCGAMLQLLIAGGMVDDVGRRIIDRLDRFNPWLGHSLRNVATFPMGPR